MKKTVLAVVVIGFLPLFVSAQGYYQYGNPYLYSYPSQSGASPILTYYTPVSYSISPSVVVSPYTAQGAYRSYGYSYPQQYQYSYPSHQYSYPSYSYGGVNPYNYSIPTGDTNALGQQLCYWEDYGRSPCSFNPHQWVYDPYTGTWY